MIWLGVGQDVFCGSVCRLVRTLVALCCALVLSSERGAFCRGDGPVPVNQRLPPVRRRRTLVDLVPEQVQVHQSCDHVKFTVELTYGAIVQVCQARVVSCDISTQPYAGDVIKEFFMMPIQSQYCSCDSGDYSDKIKCTCKDVPYKPDSGLSKMKIAGVLASMSARKRNKLWKIVKSYR